MLGIMNVLIDNVRTLELTCEELHEESAQLWGQLIGDEQFKEANQSFQIVQELEQNMRDNLTCILAMKKMGKMGEYMKNNSK